MALLFDSVIDIEYIYTRMYVLILTFVIFLPGSSETYRYFDLPFCSPGKYQVLVSSPGKTTLLVLLSSIVHR